MSGDVGTSFAVIFAAFGFHGQMSPKVIYTYRSYRVLCKGTGLIQMVTKELSEILNDATARKIITGEYMPATKTELHEVLLSVPVRQAYQIKLEGNHRRKVEEEEQ